MQEGQASRTAEYMALFRALETTRPADRRLFRDPFARAFLGARLRRVADLAQIQAFGFLLRAYIDWKWPGSRTSAVARTRFIDDAAEGALRSGTEQVVVLGAGFDSRAYRIEAMHGIPVYEVDHPSTSARKRLLIDSSLGSLPPHVHFVQVDFNKSTLASAMDQSGFHRDRRTLFLWEGVTNYLSDEAVDETLRWCAESATGSIVVFTYIHKDVLVAPRKFYGVGKILPALQAAGERWTFGLDPQHLSEYLRERGLNLVEDVGASDYRGRYYGRRAARMRGYEFYRIAVARIA